MPDAEREESSALDQPMEAADVRVEGRRGVLRIFVSLLDDFELWFNIVTP